MAPGLSGNDAQLVSTEADSSSDTDEGTQEENDDCNMQACICLSELMYLHKVAFEADSEEAAQKTLAALAKKVHVLAQPHGAPISFDTFDRAISHLSSAEDLFESGGVGNLLKIIINHPVRNMWGNGRAAPCGIWKDVDGHFHSGSAIEVLEDSWDPRGFDHSTGVKFHRDGDTLVEKYPNGSEKRMTISVINDGETLVLIGGKHKYELQAYYEWDRWDHFDVLCQVWARLNAGIIGWIIVEAGPHAKRFVHALTVKIPSDLVGSFSLARLTEVQDMPGDFGPCDSVEQFKKRLPAAWRKNAKEGGICAALCQNSTLRHVFMSKAAKVPVNYFYCGVNGLFHYPGLPVVGMQPLELVLYLEMPPDATLLFTTPLGQAVAASVWRNTLPMFVWQRIMDLLFQALLSYSVAPISRHIDGGDGGTISTLTLRWYELALIELLIFRNAFNVVGEVLVWIKLWTTNRNDGAFKAVLPFPISSVTVMRFAIEIYSMLWGIWLARDHGALVSAIGKPRKKIDTEDLVGTSLARHPMGLSILIFIKFLQFMMSLLNFKMFRSSLLPTWFAIKSKESSTFLLYMVILTFGSALAYMALPYASSLEGEAISWENWVWMYFKPFFLMFRLNIMGDFSMDELTGRKQVIKVPRTGNCTANINLTEPNQTHCNWHMDAEGPKSHHLEPYLGMCVCLGALIFPVIFLNVYVGLVAEAYSNVKNNLVQVSNSYMVSSMHSELSHQFFWNHFCCGIFGFDRWRQWKIRTDAQGTFLRLPGALVQDLAS